MVIALNACARPEIEADHVNEIDSLILEVNRINKSLSSSRLEHISGIHHQMDQDRRFFLDSVKERPPLSIRKKLELHEAIFKTVDSTLNSIHSYNEEIYLSSEMLKEYKEKYTKGDVDESELMPIIEKEKYLVRDIRERVGLRINEIENYLEDYVLIYPEILRYKKEYKARDDNRDQ
jgi:hypothetical protein